MAHVEDRWQKTVKGPDGKPVKERTARYGKGLHWRARYLDPDGEERMRSFAAEAIRAEPEDATLGNVLDGAKSRREGIREGCDGIDC